MVLLLGINLICSGPAFTLGRWAHCGIESGVSFSPFIGGNRCTILGPSVNGGDFSYSFERLTTHSQKLSHIHALVRIYLNTQGGISG